MKIQTNLTVIQGQKPTTSQRTERPAVGQTFHLSPAPLQPAAETEDVVEIVSLENRRALTGVPPQDLEAAEKLLRRITEELGWMSRNEARQVHRLEGLVQYYQPSY
ncbi:MAG: hypothetical protein AB1641_11095 [Thermodesulfobacteriota bacterium]